MSITVREFRASDAAAFAALNKRWITEHFSLEASDKQQLDRPQQEIIDRGGMIAIAELDGAIVGCGALTAPHNPPDDGRKWLELVKMATDPAAQGRGIGGSVVKYLIKKAKTRGCGAIWLETNDGLVAANRLYRNLGFQPLPAEERWPTPYARCNAQYVLEI